MLELSTIGIKLKYCVGQDSSTKPTTGYTEIENITSIGEISATPDNLEVSNLCDQWKRYIAGQRDGSGSVAIGANFTSAFKTAWLAIVSAYETALAAEKALWWEVSVPNFGSFYFTGEPNDLGLPSIETNSVFAGTVNITPNYIGGWGASST